MIRWEGLPVHWRAWVLNDDAISSEKFWVSVSHLGG